MGDSDSPRAWTSNCGGGSGRGGAAAANRRIAPRRLRNRRRLGPRSRASALDRFSVAPIEPAMNAPCVLAPLGSHPPRTSRDLPITHLEPRLQPRDDVGGETADEARLVGPGAVDDQVAE